MKYVISDLHFNHEAVIQMDNRPFNNVNEMNTSMIKRWNSVINPKDEVYILGDFAFGNTSEIMQILKQLLGRKYLIRGNHDKFLDYSDFDWSMFEWVRDIISFKINHKRYQLCHYPILEYNGMFRNQRLLYGHTHDKKPGYFGRVMSPNAVNVSACRVDYHPIGISRIEQMINAQWQFKLHQIMELLEYSCPKQYSKINQQQRFIDGTPDIKGCQENIKYVESIIRLDADNILLNYLEDILSEI